MAQGENIYLTPEIWGEENDYLLMGVAHTSVTWKQWYSDPRREAEKAMLPHTHYISFFYAFEPRPPFNIRARSGYFCLGFAAEDGSEKGPFNHHSALTYNRKLSQHNETFSCPQIHFVSSFVEKAGDPSSTVIGYGIVSVYSLILYAYALGSESIFHHNSLKERLHAAYRRGDEEGSCSDDLLRSLGDED